MLPFSHPTDMYAAIGSFLEEKFHETTSRVLSTELGYLGLPSNTLKRKNYCEKLGTRLPARMSVSATANQVQDFIVQSHGDATEPIEIDLLDLIYLSNYYVIKMLSWLAYIYTGLTESLTPLAKLVSESATSDCLAIAAFPSLIAQCWQLLQQ
jgi:hypothetical protein